MYRLGTVSTGTLSHDLNRWWHKVRGLEDPYAKIAESNARDKKGNSEYVWSLKDINFSTPHGEILGIVGRNGAGKSTLLKILSRVTGPTTGTVKMRGRVASLLEVGTGFHPELTGRENVFLNGAILGMTKKEIRQKFDEIVDFSGVERYIDTPVKRYSSGMYVRLAFGVAAHLEPEILIIDEVLAVGDAEFQKKCLGKMKDVSDKEGRTVLFVSHNMAAVKSLCNNAILLEHGSIKFMGDANSTINTYLKGDAEVANKRLFHDTGMDGIFQLHEISLTNKGQKESDILVENEEIVLNTELSILHNEPERLHLTYHLYNELGEALFSFSNLTAEIPLKKGINNLKAYFPKNFFQSGVYFLSFLLISDKKNAAFVEKDIISFSVVNEQRAIGVYMGKEPGYIRPQINWSNS